MQNEFDNDILDDEDELSEYPVTGKKKKLPKNPDLQVKRENFLRFYNEYMNPTQPLSAYRAQCLLDDMYSQLPDLFKGWAFRYAAIYHRLDLADVDYLSACSVGCEYAYNQIRQDKADNICREHPLSFYLTVARNKSIDHYFAETDFGRLPRRNKDGKFDEEDIRKKLEKLNSVLEVSMEDMMTYQDGEYHEDRDARFATDPFEQMCYSRQVRDEQNLRLLVPFIRELMNYPDEPQKPLALMYGMILFQITQACGGHDAISKAAQKSTKKRSAAWAHRRMGNLTLESLGDKSEMVVRHQYDQALAWGDSFRQYMLRTLADGTNRTWSEIVYTKTYTEAQTSNWIESITESTRKKCARMYAANPDLREIAVQKSNNALRKYMEKIEKKEACR